MKYYRILPPFWKLEEALIIINYLCSYSHNNYYKKFLQLLNNLLYPKKYLLLGSGRSAIYSIIKLNDFSKGSKIMVPSFVCSAVISPILKSCMTPVFVDILDDLTINPDDIEKKISKDVAMIIMPHVYGKVCDFTRIREIAKIYDVLLIDDAAPCAGLKYKDATMGLLGDYGIFSMNFKTISSILGGGIIFNSNDDFEIFKLKLSKYKQKKNEELFKKTFIYIINRLMYKSNLCYYLNFLKNSANLEPINEDIKIEKINDLAAAIGCCQLEKLDIIQTRREYNSSILKDILANNNNVEVVTSNRKDFFTRFIIKLNISNKLANGKLENIKQYLFNKKIQTFNVYTPNHLLLGMDCKLTNTENIWRKCLVIPNNPLYNKNDMEYIADCINSYFKKTN